MTSAEKRERRVTGRNHSRRSRWSYRFDNLMAEGMWAKIKLLLVTTGIYVLVVGLLAALARGGIAEHAQWSIWKTLMYTLGKGTLDGSEGSAAYVALMFLTILYCMFFTAILIGLINNGIRSKMDRLSQGRGEVIEEGHTLILGYHDAVDVLVGELIEANASKKGVRCVVVLSDGDRQRTADELHARFGSTRSHPHTKILCRTGSVCDFEALRRCAIESCSSVIASLPTDFDAVKAILACAHILGREEGDNYIVSVIRKKESRREAETAAQIEGAQGKLELLDFEETLARIMVHTSRQPGLADVFTELMNYKGHEFYVLSDDPSFPNLWGKTIAQINLQLKTAFAVGVYREGCGVIISSPELTRFCEGDRLIVVAENDNELMVADEPEQPVELEAQEKFASRPENVLVLGCQPILGEVLRGYAEYLEEGSMVHVADISAGETHALAGSAEGELAAKGIGLSVHEERLDCKENLNDLLEQCDPSSVLVLVDHDAQDGDAVDERTVRTLLYLREYRYRTGRRFGITSEMRQTSNKELMAQTGPDDFIIGSQLSALLMAQISQDRTMAQLFGTILSSEGFEVYMKRASWYVPTGVPLDLFTVGHAVAHRNEVLIGLRMTKDGRFEQALINPAKYVSDLTTLRRYVFSADDFLVVLAQDSGFSEQRERM